MLRTDAAARVIKDLWTSSARSGERLWAVAPEVITKSDPRGRFRQWLAQPVDALPLDVFRILIGLISLAYFVRTLRESPIYSNPDGLIDHSLSLSIFQITKMGLFHPGISLFALQSIFVLACLGSLALIAGYHVRVCAAVLYAIVVSTYRWNYPVMYIDDGIMHLMLFWLMLLPVGRTLVLSEWWSQRTKVWRRWKTATVPGTAARCFLWNVTLIYVVAGLWKWTSPMWRNGTALYAVLKLPIAWTPDFWGPQHMPALRVLNYAALLLETIFPLIFLLPKGSRAKYALLVALIGFHSGMIATLQIPFANFACIAAAVVLFGPELMSWLGSKPRSAQPLPGTTAIGSSGVIAISFVVVLTLAMLSSITLPQWRTPVRLKTAVVSDDASPEGLLPLQKAFFAPLWIAGLAQQYQLFNWIDERNYTIRYDAFDGARKIDPARIFIPTTRGTLLQAYVQGISWMPISVRENRQLRESIYIRSARRYCRDSAGPGNITVYSTLSRFDPADPRRIVEHNRSMLMQFQCRDGQPLMQAMNLNP